MARSVRRSSTIRQQLIRAGEALPASTERNILDQGKAAVPELIEVLVDLQLSEEESPGGGYAPAHAAELLGKLGATEAMDALLTVLAEASPDDILFEAALRAISALGPSVGSVLLAHLEGMNEEDPDRIASLLELCARLDLDSPVLYERALGLLEPIPGLGAHFLQRWGSEADVPRLEAKLDEILDAVERRDTEGLLFIDIADLSRCIEHFAGAQSPERGERIDEAFRYMETLYQLPASPEPALTKVGRNEACPCGSGKKYKKCHWAEDEAKRLG